MNCDNRTLADRVKSDSRTRQTPKWLEWSDSTLCERLYNKYRPKPRNKSVIKLKLKSKLKSKLVGKQRSLAKHGFNNVNNKSKYKYMKVSGNKNIKRANFASIGTQFPLKNDIVIESNEMIAKNESTIGVLQAIRTQLKLYQINKHLIEKQIFSAINSRKELELKLEETKKVYESRLKSIKSKKWCFYCFKQLRLNLGHYCNYICRAKHLSSQQTQHCLKHQ